MISIQPVDRTEKCRILLVEDDDILVDSVSVVLNNAGYELSTCGNGRDALKQLRAEPPDVVILDLMMPVMNGWEFRAAQRADQAIANVPVVVISADLSAKAIAVHADSYVRKPFQARELLQEVERVLLARARQTEVSRLEEAPRLTQLVQVAAGLGHEINNPLALAMGSLEMIDETLSGFEEDLAVLRDGGRSALHASAVAGIDRRLASTKKLVRDGQTGADRVRLIVRNLQSLAQPAVDRRRQLDLRLILDRSLSAASAQLECRSKVTRDYHEGVEVWGNERQLTNLFLNLLVNAAESISPGRVEDNTIRLTIERVENSCVVEIGDSGSGMSNALQQRIFEPFFTTKGREGGLGLGLAICRDIVESHGGQIDAESTCEAGSVFRVRLPALSLREQLEVDVHSAVTTTAIRSITTPLGARPRLWVLDDEPLIVRTVGRILAEGYDVVVLDRPGQALRRLELGETFDALLCDLMMPEMSGMEVHERIAALRPSLLPRIIFMTGGASTREAREFVTRVGLRVIDKPFEATHLRAALAAVVKPSPRH